MLTQGSKGGNLNDISSLEEDLNQSKTSADRPAVRKELSHLTGTGISADIKILGTFTNIQISYTAANEVTGEPGPIEFTENQQGVIINHLLGNWMIRRMNNTRSDQCLFGHEGQGDVKLSN
jgi:hypothetical protein